MSNIVGDLKKCLLRKSQLYIKLLKQHIQISTSFWTCLGESQFRYQEVLWYNSLQFLYRSVATYVRCIGIWYLYVIWLRLLHQKSLNFMAVLWHRYFLIKYFIQHTQEFSIFVVTNSSKAQNCASIRTCVL